MHLAILSDLHGVAEGFQRVARHAQRHNVDQLIYLGDLGHDPTLFSALRQREIACTFGNWEVSGLDGLAAPWAEWVAAWPAKIERGASCFTHATPDMPPTVTTTAEAVTYMTQQKIGWNTLFPRLHNNEEARWNALAVLETQNQVAAFHGHTHIQQTWVYQKKRWRSFDGPAEFTLEQGSADQPTRYLIGVGSAGAPQDGEALRYALYDEESSVVQLVALPAR
jgi:predicted phosphodiesterase